MVSPVESAPAIEDTIARIRAAVGDKACLTEPDDLAPFLIDQRNRYVGRTPLLVRPANTDEVATVVRICAEDRVSIVPQAGNTSMVGGSVPHPTGDEIILNLSRMTRIRAIDPLNYTMTVEAGCILADVQQAAGDADRLFPLSLAAEGSCRIGGNLASNAGGINVLKYGMARDLVLGVEAVMPDGQIWDGLRGLRKDNTGYDLKQLFVGSEGTLGIITAAVLKLFPKPHDVQTAMVAVRNLDDVLTLLVRAREASGDRVTAFEWIERIGLDFVFKHVPGTKDPLPDIYQHYALIELSSPETDSDLASIMENFLGQAIDDGLVLDGVIAASTSQAQDLWKLRESVSEAQKPEGGSIKHDISVPVSQVPTFVRRGCALIEKELPGARPVPFGHIGDGNVHFNISQPIGADKDAFLAEWDRINHLVHDLTHELGGSFSAEHGVGRMKRDDLERYKPLLEVELMRRIKAAFDPHNIMNPGKVV